MFVRNSSTGTDSGIVEGHSNAPLDVSGENEALYLAELLNGTEIASLYSSDLTRSIQTGKQIFDEDQIKLDERLRGQDFGDVVGQNIAEFIQSNPEYSFGEQGAEAAKLPFPNGESVLDVHSRVMDAVHDIVDDMDYDDRVVIVTHTTPMLCLLWEMTNQSIDKVFQRRNVKNSETFVLETDREGTLSLSDRRYLTEWD